MEQIDWPQLQHELGNSAGSSSGKTSDLLVLRASNDRRVTDGFETFALYGPGFEEVWLGVSIQLLLPRLPGETLVNLFRYILDQDIDDFTSDRTINLLKTRKVKFCKAL